MVNQIILNFWHGDHISFLLAVTYDTLQKSQNQQFAQVCGADINQLAARQF